MRAPQSRVLFSLVILSGLTLAAACDSATGSGEDGDGDGTPPDAPLPLSPEDGAVDVELRPLFRWSYEPDENRGDSRPHRERPAAPSATRDAEAATPAQAGAEQPSATVPAPPSATTVTSTCEPATSFTLQVDDDPTFADPEIDESGILGPSFKPSSELECSTEYYWRVKVLRRIGGSATGRKSGASPPWKTHTPGRFRRWTRLRMSGLGTH